MATYDFITRLGFNFTELPKWRQNNAEIQGETLYILTLYAAALAKAAAYNAAYAAAYHNQAPAKLRQAAATLLYGGRRCRIVAVANVEEWRPPNVQFIAIQYHMSS